MRLFIMIIIVSFSVNIYSQTLIGGPCEGCEAVFEFGDEELSTVDTLPDFSNNGPKLKITGVIYKNDGKTPAPDVILYVYHTNQKGIYEKRGDEKGWAKRHGFIRGWVRTNSKGEYTFYTLKPASYPNSTIPAHIHGTILEPSGNYYWIDSWQFKNDPFLNMNYREKENAYGGSGIVELKQDGNILIARRDIILGKNVPGYK